MPIKGVITKLMRMWRFDWSDCVVKNLVDPWSVEGLEINYVELIILNFKYKKGTNNKLSSVLCRSC